MLGAKLTSHHQHPSSASNIHKSRPFDKGARYSRFSRAGPRLRLTLESRSALPVSSKTPCASTRDEVKPGKGGSARKSSVDDDIDRDRDWQGWEGRRYETGVDGGFNALNYGGFYTSIKLVHTLALERYSDQ